jgi:hypothetical protein
LQKQDREKFANFRKTVYGAARRDPNKIRRFVVGAAAPPAAVALASAPLSRR